MTTETYLAWLCSAAVGMNLVQFWLFRRASRKLQAVVAENQELQAQLEDIDPPKESYPRFSNPLWGFLRVAILVGSLWGILWMTAADFDATEIRTIVGYLLVLVGSSQVSPDTIPLLSRAAKRIKERRPRR